MGDNDGHEPFVALLIKEIITLYYKDKSNTFFRMGIFFIWESQPILRNLIIFLSEKFTIIIKETRERDNVLDFESQQDFCEIHQMLS